MEVPTTAAYAICISVAGPALEQLGLPDLYAHLFVFWYALLSTVAPPLCGTVFIAAGMCGAPWLAVANRAMRLGVGLYIVPLALVANPAYCKSSSCYNGSSKNWHRSMAGKFCRYGPIKELLATNRCFCCWHGHYICSRYWPVELGACLGQSPSFRVF